MASYNSLVYDSSGDGWTVTYKIKFSYGSSQHNINDSDFYTDISNYSGPTGASWYQHSWWVDYNDHGPQVWAKIYHNTSGVDLVLKSMSFLTCACNSAGQSYMAAGGILSPTIGYGVTFRARYYTSSASGVCICDSNYSVPNLNAGSSLDKNNWLTNYGNIARYRGEYGRTSTTINPHFGGCRSGYYVGDSELKYYVKDPDNYGPKKALMEFSDGLVVEDQGYIFLIVDIVDWHGGSIGSQTLVMLGDDPYFDGDLEPDDKPYIWRMTDMGDGTRKWQKTRYPFMWSGTNWVKMNENNSDKITEIQSKK